MKVLIIGGAGFIGSAIAEHLASRDNTTITIVDNYFRGKKDKFIDALIEKPNVKLIEADLTSYEQFSKLENEYDQVYMLASVVGVEYTSSMPDELIRINTLLIINTLEWLKTIRCGKVLFSSTSECYAGAIDRYSGPVPTSEEIPLCVQDVSNPRFSYAITKMLGETGFLQYGKKNGFGVTIVRYHNVYGPRMGFKHVVPQVVVRMLKGESPFRIFGADQTRAFNYISDAVAGTVGAMNSENTSGEIIHIGDMRSEITIETLVKYIGAILNFGGDYEIANAPAGSVVRRCPDTTKANKLFGYEPEVDWKDGVNATVKWYQNYLASNGDIYE